MAESFFATLEREWLNRRRFKSQAEAKMAVFEWIEGWYIFRKLKVHKRACAVADARGRGWIP
jgi:transposase InsO family protein